MTTVGEVLAILDAWAPFSEAASWDPVGLQLGDPDASIERVAVCHEVTPAIVDAVLADAMVGLVVTYHPLLFRPLDRITPGPGPAGQSLRLLTHGVALIAAHTNVDVAPGGASDALAAAVGLREVRPFGRVDANRIKVVVYAPASAVADLRSAMAAAGAGSIGLYRQCSFEAPGSGRFVAPVGTDPVEGTVGGDNEVAELRLEMSAHADRAEAVLDAVWRVHPYEEPAVDVYDLRNDGPKIGRVGSLAEPATIPAVAAQVADALGEPPIRFSAATSEPVRMVAVVPGAGSDLAAAAHRAGAEVLVTGDARHHATVAATRLGLSMVDATHEGTERPGMKALYRAVASQVPALDLTTMNTNPWRSS